MDTPPKTGSRYNRRVQIPSHLVEDAIIIQRQLYEMGVKDFSIFYHYNLGAMLGVPDKKLIEGLKGASYTTAGPRAAEYKKNFREKFETDFNDAWTPPFYDAAWIVAIAINMAQSLDPKAIRNAMWPAAYVYPQGAIKV